MAKVLRHKRYITDYPEDVKSDMYNLLKKHSNNDNDNGSSNSKKSVRVLNWTDKERKELEFNIKENHHDVFDVFDCIYDQDNRYPSLVKKFNMAKNNPEETLQLTMDIVDYFNGTACFPKIAKYYIHLVDGDKGYLNQNLRNNPEEKIYFDSKAPKEYLKTQFTYEEVIALDPRYKEFMEQVPEDEVVK